MPLHSLDEGHYEVPDRDSYYEEGDVVAAVHLIHGSLHIRGSYSPREDADEDIDELGDRGSLVSGPAVEVPLRESGDLL